MKKRGQKTKCKNNKRGLSTVVTTLIIVLLVLIAIAIIWIVLSNLIVEDSEIAQAKARMLQERVDIKKIQFGSDSILNVSLQKLTGSSFLKGIEIIEPPKRELHVVSVADISASMRACYNVDESCCTNFLEGQAYGSGVCIGVPLENMEYCEEAPCSGNPIEALIPSQTANKNLVDALFNRSTDENKMGLVAYNQRVIQAYSSDLTIDNETLKNIIDSWDVGLHTCICCGINGARYIFERGSQAGISKTMIVMSDGLATETCDEQNTNDAKQDAINSACQAYNEIANLTIHTVALGDADLETMYQIAQCGHGQNFTAYNVNNLTDIYKAIADQIVKDYISKHNFNYLKIVFYSETDSVTKKINIPNVLEIKKYEFDLTGEITPPIIQIEVYPVVVSSSGKEIIGNALDIWEA